MNLNKFTDEYIATTAAEALNAERKALIRHTLQCQEVTRKMRERLVVESEERHAEQELSQMPVVKRQALERAIAKGHLKGTGTVR